MKLFNYIALIVGLCLGNITMSFAQTSPNSKKESIQALNAFVLYVNEVNNYLPIINSLMVDYNMKLNQYVDLPSQTSSSFSNALFPNNLFDEVIFHNSPNELYKKAMDLSRVLPEGEKSKIVGIAKVYQENTSYINVARFEVENLLNKLDLTKREDQVKVYEKMETVAKAFKDAKKLQYELEYQLKTSFKNIAGQLSSNNQLMKSLDDLYQLSRLAIEAVYEGNNVELPGISESLGKTMDQYTAVKMDEYNGTFWMNSTTQGKLKSIKNKTSDIIAEVKRYLNYEFVPERYKLYGRSYYFYNHSLLLKLNRFGMGIAAEINEIYTVNRQDRLYYFELPYDFKVIYPRILREEVFLPSANTFLPELPQVVQGRKVVKSEKKIRADKLEIEFEVFDHKIIDNDIVSILFNDEWILEKFVTTEKKHKFKIKLNPNGVNYLMLHADDVGKRPPATITLAYTIQGNRITYVMNADLNTSEVIEIRLEK
ncbi:MAG: hypothetical protein IPL63_03090 [Saprospiraceae bacterium]|nr:hypothetical protein [Saprospiraceae bacterium]MBK6566735.1 hypothetical protein [Saprospiraceae bacterium]MBK8370693.1 hypothetical protein [Saprospiraceae bacterium]MBK8546394.1 hypothetical protein [Saprospiraceae bacterium]MBK8854455.1 hypothetical protein [Saprospiraceae bacterium]